MVDLRGKLPTAFSAVSEAFDKNFQEYDELGASFCVIRDGECLIDVHAGFRNKQKTEPWADETIACIFSSGKAVVAQLMGEAVTDGLFSYSDPVAAHWPGFAQNGKSEITIAQILSHQAGLPGFVDEIDPNDWLDWQKICTHIEVLSPLWPPGSESGYAPQLFGFLAGEVYRRATGKTIGEAIAARTSDLFCGLPVNEQARASVMPKPKSAPDLGELNRYTKAAFLTPWSSPAKAARADWMAAQLPGSNMHANARGLASFVHPLANDGVGVDGKRRLNANVIGEIFTPQCSGNDLVLPFEITWGTGAMINEHLRYGPNPKALGQSGFGGSAVVIDPDQRMTIAYVMNAMSPHLVADPRSLTLINAVYKSL